MILALLAALLLVGGVADAFWFARKLRVGATRPRRTSRTGCLDPDPAGQTAGGQRSP
jgi:hypothetical protein